MSATLAFTVLLTLAGAPPGDTPPDAEDHRMQRGSVSYRVHCANCHGDDAAGRGPMAEILKVAPTDLTTLAERHDGAFPREKVYRSIDGRDEIPAHGRRGMPVWGLGLQDPGRDSDQEGRVREQILDLVAYLETLQRP